jgi:hypothetical protein
MVVEATDLKQSCLSREESKDGFTVTILRYHPAWCRTRRSNKRARGFARGTSEEPGHSGDEAIGQEALIGSGSDKGSVEKLLQYSSSLAVAAALVGMPTHEMIRQNAQLARNFAPMPEEEMRDFSHRMAGANKMALDLRFRDHLDC